MLPENKKELVRYRLEMARERLRIFHLEETFEGKQDGIILKVFCKQRFFVYKSW